MNDENVREENEGYRITRDSLGEVRVPASRYYGAQTQRAVENFPISGLRLPRAFIRAQGILKRAAALANRQVGALDERRAEAIVRAAEEVIAGKLDEHFVVDVFQAGAGTSQNMNANEVIANRAAELLGGKKGDLALVHPNDHVNMAQSTNDTIHVAIHIAALEVYHKELIPALDVLYETLQAKAREFDDILKSGRTHLQDAVPMRLGQEFGGYAGAVAIHRRYLDRAAEGLLEIGMGGTAVGTGLNAHPRFGALAVEEIARYTGLPFRLPENLFTFVQNLDAVAQFSGALRGLAVALTKIANDIRLLSSGPRTGIGELQLPAVQPGSSIMPGKVNPVMAEMLNMVCFQVMGCDTAVAAATSAAQLELNVMMPVIAFNVLFAESILAQGIQAFVARALRGLAANRARCEETIEWSTAIVTALNPVIGYDRAAEVAKTAYREGKTVRQVLREQGILPEEEIARVLDVRHMTGP